MAKKVTTPKARAKPKASKGAEGAEIEAKPKLHERKAKPSEEDKVATSRRLAASYLAERDGMDIEIAVQIVAGMDGVEVMELIAAANTAVMATTPAQAPAQAPNPLPGTGNGGDAKGDAIPYHLVPILASVKTEVEIDGATSTLDYTELVTLAIVESREKNRAEKAYKVAKSKIIEMMKFAGVEKVECMGANLTVYTGHTRTLSDLKLIDKGVDIAIINQCWNDTPWDDVRILTPKDKTGKGARGEGA